ncbi:MAG: hypothetical protein JWM76_705 [Pseudonocardiales bacterium]|nr:hypothetical protein [Pseudonocardiales bacterium]
MLIDCDTCKVKDIGCSDCVVTLLLGAPDASIDVDASEATAFGILAAGGLTPPLRLVPVHRHRGQPDPASGRGSREASA